MGLEDARALASLPVHERARVAFDAEQLARREPELRAWRRLRWLAGIAVAAAWVAFPFLAHENGHLAVLLPVGLTILAAATAIVSALRAARLRRRHLREALLIEHLHPATCFRCSTTLRGIEGSRCPRCGTGTGARGERRLTPHGGAVYGPHP